MARQLINHILAGTAHVLRDPRVELVLEALYTRAQRAADEKRDAPAEDPDAMGDFGYSLSPTQGELLYLLCRATRARTVVEFCSSEGATAIYLAAALRDNGGGTVIGADSRPDRIRAARNNLADAGLSEYADLRCGEPEEVLADVEGPIDLVSVDGWPELAAPSRARRTMEVLVPRLRSGALVLNDGREPDYLDLVRAADSPLRTTVVDIGLLSVAE
ncbi:class I SAM-dependent methyltransferase [Amycolatopsis acidicola]|uniref:Class I SAM-dependent methyltransferase n=1 Tax=Amycolatopsis acidicola TaxID=2596893 RepID=A0A5N0V2W3_9PSEU|nr:class I SAM-dependent methyltransferase [Amycolatopsis acidicola]KAA9159098.1 class I SAM-dependent methyltransferase [Amycolatopsis acidicola]